MARQAPASSPGLTSRNRARAVTFRRLRESGLSYEEIGERYGLSRERVRQILRTAGYRKVRRQSGKSSPVRICRAADRSESLAGCARAAEVSPLTVVRALRRAGKLRRYRELWRKRQARLRRRAARA